MSSSPTILRSLTPDTFEALLSPLWETLSHTIMYQYDSDRLIMHRKLVNASHAGPVLQEYPTICLANVDMLIY